MKLFNTLSRKEEEFKAIDNKNVSYYTCGPTVYDVAHIGNLRTYIFEDILKRVLILNNFSVKHVMNITDVDDKTIKRSNAKKKDFEKIITKYEDLFFDDLKNLNIIQPDIVIRATEYIDKIVSFIQDLEKKGYAYRTSDRSIYFSISKFLDYGKLSKLDKEGIKVGARVNQDEYDKESPADFVLWKAWNENDGEIYWQTSLGKGRPGWHIECSAMANDALGDTIDIHAGAVDLIFPHHENEIAQSEARNGKKFVNFWIHGEHLLVDGKKMAKKSGNFYTLLDLKKKGYSPLDFRYLVLGAHYRSKLNFTWEGLTAAKNSRERLNRLLSEIKSEEKGIISDNYFKQFLDRVNDDLDTPGSLAVLWQMLRDGKIGQEDKLTTFLEMNKILGLSIKEEVPAPEAIIELAEKRKKAKIDKDFEMADKIREQIENEGWTVEDLENNSYKLIQNHN